MPGESIIAASSKVLTKEDLRAMVDASMDLWLTSGRYAEKYKKDLD